MALSVNTQAPDFVLKSKDGDFSDYRLSEQRGSNVVLLFVPGAFTGVCTEEMCQMTDMLGAMATLNAKVFGISVDSAFAQEAWKKANDIKFPLLSDFKHEVVELYDCVLPDLAGLGPASKRVVYVIDKEGVIRYVEETNVPSDQIDFKSLKSALEAL